jgi:hypothetical protein
MVDAMVIINIHRQNRIFLNILISAIGLNDFFHLQISVYESYMCYMIKAKCYMIHTFTKVQHGNVRAKPVFKIPDIFPI